MQFFNVYFCQPVSLIGQQRSHNHFTGLSLVKCTTGHNHTTVFVWIHSLLAPGALLTDPHLNISCFSAQGVKFECINTTVFV